MYSYFFSASFAQDISDLVWLGLSSTFVSTAIVASIGAGFGAWMAGFIARRNELKRQRKSELLAVHKALAWNISIANTILMMKEQHIDAKVRKYESELERVHKLRNAGRPIESEPDMEELQFVLTADENLRHLANEEITPVGNQLLLVAQMANSIASLKDIMDKRNGLINWFRERDWNSDEEKIQVYFALPDSGGTIDARFKSTFDGMMAHANAVIAFCWLLQVPLTYRGDELVRRLGHKKQKLPTIDFEKMAADGKVVMPCIDEYSEWATKLPVKYGFLRRLKGRIDILLRRVGKDVLR